MASGQTLVTHVPYVSPSSHKHSSVSSIVRTSKQRLWASTSIIEFRCPRQCMREARQLQRHSCCCPEPPSAQIPKLTKASRQSDHWYTGKESGGDRRSMPFYSGGGICLDFRAASTNLAFRTALFCNAYAQRRDRGKTPDVHKCPKLISPWQLYTTQSACLPAWPKGGLTVWAWDGTASPPYSTAADSASQDWQACCPYPPAST